MRDLLTKYRGIIIFLFVVPSSFIVNHIQVLHSWYRRNFRSSQQLHDIKVREIAAEVARAYGAGKKMCTARAPWKTMSIRKSAYKDDMVQIPVNLKNILELDSENNFIRVEPLVTMAEITRYLIPRGYALAVQVEMDDLTVGGLCMGIGIETSSHKYGFLFETIRAYELITADGTVVRAAKEENADLFHALPMSHGSLGFLTAVELEVVAIKPYLKIQYIPCHSIASFSEVMTALSMDENPPSFLEGLIYNNEEGVVMAGEFADKPDETQKINRVNRWYKPWFYMHVRTFLEKGEAIEYIPARHYFHRHTPAVFFQLKDLIPFANRPWYRWLFGWLGAPKISLMKFSMTRTLRRRAFQNRVAQDIVLPLEHLEEAVDYAARHFMIYPLWVCPVRIFNHGESGGLLRNPTNLSMEEMYVDLGIYGISPRVALGNWDSVSVSRALEDFTRSRHGFHMLYADIFMTREEFEQMFNHDHYRTARDKYKASEVFPEVYDKVIPEKWLIDLESFDQVPEEIHVADWSTGH